MRLMWLAPLALVFGLILPITAQAASYPPDMVCPTPSPPAPPCTAAEQIATCTTVPNTHIATIRWPTAGSPPTVRCVDNAPLPVAMMDAYYPGYYDAYGSYYGCIVPNTVLYTGTSPIMPPDTCISTPTTPAGWDGYGWFCEDNVTYRPQSGPQGYKCVLRNMPTCPGIPPYELQPIPGYANSWECVPVNPPVGTCSSTETYTLTVVGPPPDYACVQNWPWDAATLPPDPQCPAGESLVANGAVPPILYGCKLDNTCPAGQTMEVTSPPGVRPVVFACVAPAAPTCPVGETPWPNVSANPVTYTCCPNGQQLDLATMTCTVVTTPGVPTCPPGQIAQPSTGSTSSYYICSPPAGAPCPVGQNRQAGVCVPNSSSLPTCNPGQTPTVVPPSATSSYVCVPLTTCPAGQRLDTIANPPVCVPDPGYPTTGPCAAGQIVEVLPGPTYNCVNPPAVPACPPGQYAAVTGTSPLTYGCTNGGN